MKSRLVPGLIVSSASAAGLAALLLSYATNGAHPDSLGAALLERSLSDTRSVNVVTGVLLDFRAFDTIGEATVIFASVAAVAAAFAGSGVPHSDSRLGLLVRRSVGYLAPLFLLFPLYIVAHGHLSPGGGFQGGVSLAVLLILLTVAFGARNVFSAVRSRTLHVTEAVCAGAFVAVGIVGMTQGVAFLTNLAAGFPSGEPGSLLSAGMIPLLNLFIGLKVASGLGSIFFDLFSSRSK
ncbi:MAG: hydrogen gas-evolving membrane-bound hydrogenase subunit E [Spirochaetota bacterium]